MPTYRDINRFTCGDCHILASRIHRLTGWEFATFRDNAGNPVDHAFVIHPSGDAVDVNGRMPLHKFAHKWGWEADEVKTWTLAEFRKSTWMQGTAFGPYSYARARVVAGGLLDNLGWKP